MPEESRTSDLVELTRRTNDALGRGDYDGAFEAFAPDAIWDVSRFQLGVHVGPAAARGQMEDWVGMFEDFKGEVEELRTCGGGVVFLVYRQEGRPLGSSGVLSARGAQVIEYADRRVVRVTFYPDIDEARTAAEHLAEERV
jgi:ketosteroid isomerase-like protein